MKITPLWLLWFFVVMVAGPLRGQAPGDTAAGKVGTGAQTAPLLSPGAAYQEALRPVTVTRASVANWSATEQAALGVAIHQAALACEVRPVKDYTGDSLVDLGHLCSMGQDFAKSLGAVSRYLEEASPRAATSAPAAAGSAAASATPSGTERPARLAEAYALEIDAELHLKDEKAAFATAQEMLAKAPFGQTVEDAIAEGINYMQLLFTGDAETLAAERQGRLLAAIESAGSSDGTAKDAIAAGLPALYEQALVLPELEQLNGNLTGAQKSIRAIEAAVPASVSQDDVVAMAGWRQRYAQLGKPLGSGESVRSLTLPPKMPQIPAPRAVTALLLFPDWCAQCVRMARAIPESVFSVEAHEAYMYGLLVETVAPEKPAPARAKNKPADAEAFNPADAARDLQGTSSVLVRADMLERFHAVDVPLLIVADAEGVVRFISPVDETALQPGSTVDAAVAKVAARWPAVGGSGQSTGPTK